MVGIVAIGWQSYLSYLNQKARMEEDAEKSQRSGTDGTVLPPLVQPDSSRVQA